MIAIAAALAIDSSVRPEPPDEGPPLPPAVLHVVVRSDLNAAKLADRVTDAIDSALTRAVLLEFASDASRADVTLAIIGAVRRHEGPLAVYLRDPDDRRVGTGAVAIGLAAPDCFIDPDTHVRADPSNDLSRLAATERDADPVVLRAAIEPWLPPSPDAPILARLLAAPTPERSTRALYLVRDGSSMRVTEHRPERAPIPLVIVTRREPPVLHLTAHDACEIGLCREARTPSDAVRELGWRVSPVDSIVIGDELADARACVADALGAAERSLTDAKRILRLPDPPNASVAPSRYRQVGADAGAILDAAREQLAGAASRAESYPELLREPPPGDTSLAESRSSLPARWRSRTRSLADRLATLDSRARLFREQ